MREEPDLDPVRKGAEDACRHGSRSSLCSMAIPILLHVAIFFPFPNPRVELKVPKREMRD